MADFLSEPISKLSDAIIYVAATTADFKPQLEQLRITLHRITSNIDEITKLNRELDRPEQNSTMFTSIIKEAEDLVNKSVKIKWNYWKKFTHSLKLKKVDNKLIRVFQLEAQADQCRDLKKTLLEVKAVRLRMDSLVPNMGGLRQTRREQVENEVVERRKLGWRVPKLPKDIVGFNEPLARLKAKVLSDSDDSSVVVVSAAGGCGKTTLVKMLCNDRQIQEKFGENLFFVTVSETPNFMVIVNDLLNPNYFGQQVGFQSSEDAKNKLENFLDERASSPILLVLDDVWSESFINNFVFEIGRYKVVVTSRMVITVGATLYVTITDHLSFLM